MSEPVELGFDVSAVVPEEGHYETAAWLFAPPAEAIARPLTLIVAVPGGGYSKAYYHMRIPGNPGYSFGEYMAEKGFPVLALDHIGVGESTRLRDGDLIDLELMAACIDEAVRQIRPRIAAGDLLPGLAATTDYRILGIGHSVGGAVMTTGQALFESFDGVGILGTTNLWPKHIQTPPDGDTPDERRERTIENLGKLIGDKWDEVYFKVDRSKVRHWFHLDDVPDDVVAADNAAATFTARMVAVDTQTPLKRVDLAGRITVPVLFALGEVDASPDPGREPGIYARSREVTFYELPRSAHCHNFASTRHQLWDRIGAWAGTI
jgi:pimeloyl-ACP methyl ester carboxylesterase